MKAITIILTATVLSLASCSGNSASKSNGSDSIATDTVVAEAPAVVEEFITSDLSYANVKGHVKKVSDYHPQYGEYNSLEFDTDGNLTKFEGHTYSKLSRDAEGRISGGDNGYYTVIWKNGRVERTIYNESDGTLMSYIFTYDNNGNAVSMEARSEGGPEEDSSTTYTYTYGSDSFDDNGNWIKRNVHSSEPGMNDTTEQRKIYYY